MASYDQSKDKLLKLFEMKKDKSSILFSIFSYNGGQPKLRLSRSYDKKDGTTGYGNIGGIALDEMEVFNKNI